MNIIFDIRVQKLFFITFVLKVGSSFLGWYFQDPWILGFTIPLVIMCAYILLGHFRHDNEVTDEKFADTCYYLGFIFTITSIIFSLFDLPHIGTRIQDIAVRFGAAMVSTVLGLAVRVYLVSFKKDAADAIKDAEDAILDATRKFTAQLTIVLERLRDFETQVDTTAKASVERVNSQVEDLSKNHADKLTAFFTDLTSKNQETLTSALAEVKTASQKLAVSVDGYALGMRANLESIEARVGSFTDAVTKRLKTTTFPDDFFARHLSSPLTQLKASSSELAAGIKGSLQEVTESSSVLSSALKKLQDKASATEGSLDTVLKLTQQQQAVLDAAHGQITSLEQLGGTLKDIDETLASTLAGLASNNSLTLDLTACISNVVADGAETRRTLEAALNGVTETLKAQVQATNTVVTTLDAGTAASKESAQELASRLDASTTASEAAYSALTAASNSSTVVVDKLNAVAAADMMAVQAISALGQQVATALNRVDGAVEQLQGMVRQFTELDMPLQAHGSENTTVESHLQGDASGGLSATNVSPPLLGQPAPRLPQVQPIQTAHSGEQAAAPAWTRPASPIPSPAGLEATALPPGNSATHGAVSTGNSAAGPAPDAPQNQVPPPGLRLPEQSAASTPLIHQPPPST